MHFELHELVCVSDVIACNLSGDTHSYITILLVIMKIVRVITQNNTDT